MNIYIYIYIYIYANCVEEKNMILHIFMYYVISDFSVVTPASEGRVNAIYEYLRVLSSKQVNPLIIPPDALR